MHSRRVAEGAEPQSRAGGRPALQPQRQGAPLPGGAQTPQPPINGPQHRPPEADGGGGLPVLPAPCRQAEVTSPEAAAEAEPHPSQQSGVAPHT